MIPLDTTAAAAAVQEAAYRNLGPQGRLRAAFELSNLVHRLAVTGIRRRNPKTTIEQAGELLARQLYSLVR